MKSKILPIAGDASFRKFFRIVLNKKKKILIKSQKEKYKNLVAYAAVNKYLRKNKILAPKLIKHNYSKGEIIIEDFGNLSFYNILIKQKKKLNIYKKLVDLLLKIQKIKPKKKIDTIFNKKHFLDEYSYKYLNRESNLFFQWYLPLFLNKKKATKIKKKIKKILAKIYKKLYFPNSCFVHRDFHTQNLMQVGKRIGVIDTQDALIGNPAYDLVSLIDDVRIETSSRLKNQIYNYYLKSAPNIYKYNSKKFLNDFNILSIQRSLKIIGIFSRLSTRDKKEKYLKLIPYTWKLLESRMKHKDFSELKKILKKIVPINSRKKISYK